MTKVFVETIELGPDGTSTEAHAVNFTVIPSHSTGNPIQQETNAFTIHFPRTSQILELKPLIVPLEDLREILDQLEARFKNRAQP